MNLGSLPSSKPVISFRKSASKRSQSARKGFTYKGLGWKHQTLPGHYTIASILCCLVLSWERRMVDLLDPSECPNVWSTVRNTAVFYLLCADSRQAQLLRAVWKCWAVPHTAHCQHFN